MPWNQQGGGPWGGSGGNGGGKSPWGRSGGPNPPDLEDWLRKGQERVRRLMPGGMGNGAMVALVILGALALWGLSGFYTVQPDQQGVVLRFGKWVRTTQPGLNYHWPAPIETVIRPRVTVTNRIDIGFRGAGEGGRGTGARAVPEESQMLTGDENIVDVNFIVYWKIADAGQFLFDVRDPVATIKIAAESAMREVMGQTNIQTALTSGRAMIQTDTQRLLQHILNSYKAGVLIEGIQLQKVDPPGPVIDAFNDVQRAKQDKARLQNEAQAYANTIVPRAKGDAARVIQEAKAYQAQVVDQATGDAQRFLKVYQAYTQAKDITEQRLYLETMEDILSKVNKVVVDPRVAGGQGVVPYLPLPGLKALEGRQPVHEPAAEPAKEAKP